MNAKEMPDFLTLRTESTFEESPLLQKQRWPETFAKKRPGPCPASFRLDSMITWALLRGPTCSQRPFVAHYVFSPHRSSRPANHNALPLSSPPSRPPHLALHSWETGFRRPRPNRPGYRW